MPIGEAVIKGTEEIGGPLIAGTLTTLLVFGPIIFVQGLAAALFRDLSLSVVTSVAASLVWATRPAPRRGLALALFAAGFLINLSWSPVFFRLHMISAALAIIGLLFIVALVTTLLFARINRLAAWAMVPYLVWLCVAGTLNARIMMLNPTADATQLGV